MGQGIGGVGVGGAGAADAGRDRGNVFWAQ